MSRMLKAIILMPNEKTTEVGSLLAIARGAARRREGIPENPPIRALRFIAELGVYVAVYEAVEKTGPGQDITRR